MEVVDKKHMVDRKISEIESVLQYNQSDLYAKALIALIEEKQSLLIDINAANSASFINIGNNNVPISTAIIIRDTILSKIKVLTGLIMNKDCMLDKVELQIQRDKYYDEYTLINMGIRRNDLQVNIN